MKDDNSVHNKSIMKQRMNNGQNNCYRGKKC